MATILSFLLQLLKSLPVGVGQIYGCDNPWTGAIFLCAILLSSPLMCLHAAIGSLLGVIAGEYKTCNLTLASYPSRACRRHLSYCRAFPRSLGKGRPHKSLYSILLFVPSSDHSCFSLQDSVLQLHLKTSMLGSGVSTVLWPALQLEACSWHSPGRPTSWLSPVVSSQHMVWVPICRGCP